MGDVQAGGEGHRLRSEHRKEESAEEKSSTSIRFINARNSSFVVPENRDQSNIKEIVVWGGCVANCGEQSLSAMVDQQRNLLSSFTYCPSWTKGGVLVRPKYWLGDRAGSAVFPSLMYLAIRLEPPVLPEDYGWVVPALRRLRLLHIMQRGPQDGSGVEIEPCLPSRAALKSWLDTDASTSFSRRVLEASPELESITLALASTAGQSQESLDWIHLAPPRPVAWEIHRLLLLPVYKPEGSCSMSALTLNMVSNILNFLGSDSWQRCILKLPPAQMEKLGLPQDFESRAVEGLF